MAGAILANAPLLILAFIFSFIEFEVPINVLSTFAFVSVFSGATIAGFLVAGRANTHFLRVGTVTGLLSFLVYGVMVSFFFGDKSGGVWLVIGFVVGGCVGGTLRKVVKSKVNRN
ncbi:MAG: TIGR04086 family membrane protein [Candidatus Bathyarchaeia archaeon]